MVEIACLKMSCSWLLVSRTTEYLSKERMRPVRLNSADQINGDIRCVLYEPCQKKNPEYFAPACCPSADLLQIVYGPLRWLLMACPPDYSVIQYGVAGKHSTASQIPYRHCGTLEYKIPTEPHRSLESHSCNLCLPPMAMPTIQTQRFLGIFLRWLRVFLPHSLGGTAAASSISSICFS